mmetsp:Transcript_134944/g.262793  ORF Transcript_134944/g.262793 Transcript_134944/m.262793 type:complete len:499 (+) Transcript_134944:52-1548(+)
MPLDKSRIQGFGSDGPAAIAPPECPEGHELQLWAARSGKCDKCNKKISAGEIVMDCRRCNYYLCHMCCPPSKAQDSSSVWGAISALPFYVLDDMSQMVNEVENFASTSALDDRDGSNNGGKTREKQPAVPISPRQKAEAVRVVTEFCNSYPATRVVPNTMDLDVLWAGCGVLQPKPVADAIYEQLSFSAGDGDWQPRLRALYALEFFHLQGGRGEDIARTTLSSAKPLLLHLVTVPQCCKKAEQVIAVLTGSKLAEATTDSKDSGAVANNEGKIPAKVLPKGKTCTKAPDLLDMPPSVAKPVSVDETTGDLLDMPLVNQRGFSSDMIDLFPAAVTTPAAGSSASFDPNAQPQCGQSTTAKLADIYALYSEAGRTQPCINGGFQNGLSQLQPAVGCMPGTSAFATQQPTQSVPAGGMFCGPTTAIASSANAGTLNPARPEPVAGVRGPTRGEAGDAKDKGLESLLSDAVANLASLGSLPEMTGISYQQEAGMQPRIHIA